MLKVAIVGCGKIADAHVIQIQRIKGCRIVGVCDSEPLMARQLCERYSIPEPFSDVEALINVAKPDVIHITTPPQSHFEIAKYCLEQSCHVYVEKPFTVCEEQAQILVALANERDLKLTVGHDYQFSHVSQRMRALVASGFLGGDPIHMECYNSFEFGKSGFAGALLTDKEYWERRLPGNLLQNNISHGIARIAEYLQTDTPLVIAHGFTSPFLKDCGEKEIIDELRVIILDGTKTSAYFTFSSQFRPSLNQFRVFGSQNGLLLDQFQESLIELRGQRFKLFAEHFVPPFIFVRQHMRTFITNLRAFLARDFHMKSGMKYLIERFYHSIVNNDPLPIPYRQILLTAKIMDSIFAQLNGQKAQEVYSDSTATRGIESSASSNRESSLHV